ncbi:MAG: microcin ABC transporter ATP-binding protein [Magnetococcales bacterium]|nr:microcin ABC transporter ATP-binding protein [Magnetococcales bacterium]
MKKNNLLSVQNLKISFGNKTVVQGVSFDLAEGETLCLVGESGSGKSLTSLSVMGLLPEHANIKADSIEFESFDMLNMSEDDKRPLRGREMSMIFQEPMTALNPVMTVGKQVAEVFEIHTKLSKKEIKTKVLDLFKKVKIPNPQRRYDDYPFQLSGGQRQRVMIAMALAMKPKLLIADEPTTALDVTVQGEILNLIKSLQKEMGMAVLFITHDFGVVREMADKVVVMKDGKVVESGAVKSVIEQPQHAYTQKLLAAMPELIQDKKEEVLGETIIEVNNVSKIFKVKEGGFFGKTKPFHALKNVSFSIKRGETVGVVGESGCGKSTLSRCLVRLYDLDEGVIRINGEDTTFFNKKQLKAMRREMQMVFQDPYSSLNPRMKVGETISEGLKAHKLLNKKERRDFVEKLLKEVGLPKESYDRYPHQFSGGQRQRIGIARALALRPALIVADEAVSALDVSVQKQVLDLMQSLKEKYDLSYMFVSHDLRVVSQVSDRVIVMKDGEIVEQGPAYDIFKKPKHPYTKQLLAAIPK